MTRHFPVPRLGGRRLALPFVLFVTMVSALAASGPLTQAARLAPRPKVEQRVPYEVGETLDYDVSWSSYLTAGKVTFTVEAKRPSYGSTAYYVVAEAKPVGVLAGLYTLYYKADTLIDVFTLLPQRGSIYSREGRRERMKVTLFDHATRTATFQMRTTSTMEKAVGLGVSTQDVLSAIYAIRTIAPRPGERITMPVTDSGTLYRVQLVVGQPEPTRLADGSTVQAMRLSPTVVDEAGQTRNLRGSVWLAADGTYKPVRFEASLPVGRIVLALQ